MIKFIKRLFCRHNYISLSVMIERGENLNKRERYMMCKCGICGKVKALKMK